MKHILCVICTAQCLRPCYIVVATFHARVAYKTQTVLKYVAYTVHQTITPSVVVNMCINIAESDIAGSKAAVLGAHASLHYL